MLAGVSKSGSPAPRPMTLRPAALSERALSVTAMVADGFTRSSAADRNGIMASLQTWNGFLRPRLLMMGEQIHPRPRSAALQEALAQTGQTLENVKERAASVAQHLQTSTAKWLISGKGCAKGFVQAT